MRRKRLQFLYSHPAIISILIVVVLGLAISLRVLTSQQQQGIRQPVAGTVMYASPGNDLNRIVTGLQAGETLILNDGIYSNQSINATGLQGTATAPITIQAAHDGKAVIDGGGTVDFPVRVINSTYVTIQGIVAHDAGREPVYVSGHSDHITLRRITAYDAAAGNEHIFAIEGESSDTVGPTNILVEDCAAWGRGRYSFVAYHASNVTFRRTWARWTTMPDYGSDAPRACYSSYSTSNTIFENAICTHAIPDQPDSSQYFTSVWETSNGPANVNTQYYGVIFFDSWDGLWNSDSAGDNTQIHNSVIGNIKQQGPHTTDKEHGVGIHWDNHHSGTIDSSTIVNNEVGLSQNAATTTVTNSVFLNNGTAVNGDITQNHNGFFQNGSLGINADTTDKQVDPGYDVNKYGKGAYLFVPPNSPLKHVGANGADIGANIIYESVNGQLTDMPLWPWPMEGRIKAETGMSVTWEAGGGFWKTLDGVYPNVPLSPPSTPYPLALLPLALLFSIILYLLSALRFARHRYRHQKPMT
jgi:hypothetical protein